MFKNAPFQFTVRQLSSIIHRLFKATTAELEKLPMASYAGPSAWLERDSDDNGNDSHMTPRPSRRAKFNRNSNLQRDTHNNYDNDNNTMLSPLTPDERRILSGSNPSGARSTPQRVSYLSDESEQPLARPFVRRDLLLKFSSVISRNDSPNHFANTSLATSTGQNPIYPDDVANAIERLRGPLLGGVNMRLPDRSSYVLRNRRFATMTDLSEGRLLPTCIGDIRLRQEHVAEVFATARSRRLIWAPLIHYATAATTTSPHFQSSAPSSSLQSPPLQTLTLPYVQPGHQSTSVTTAASLPTSSTTKSRSGSTSTSMQSPSSPAGIGFSGIPDTMNYNSGVVVLMTGPTTVASGVGGSFSYCGISVVRNAIAREMDGMQRLLHSLEVRKYDLCASDIHAFFAWFKLIENFTRVYLFATESTIYTLNPLATRSTPNSTSIPNNNSNEYFNNNLTYWESRLRCNEKTAIINLCEKLERLRRPMLALDKKCHEHLEELRRRCDAFATRLMRFVDGEVQHVESILHTELSVEELDVVLHSLVSQLRKTGGVYGKNIIMVMATGLGVAKTEREIWIRDRIKSVGRVVVQMAMKKLKDRHWNFVTLFETSGKEYKQVYENLGKDVDRKVASVRSSAGSGLANNNSFPS